MVRDNRTKTMEFITRTFTTVTQFTRLFQENVYMNIDPITELTSYQRSRADDILRKLQTLRKEVESSLKGIGCLRETYKDTSEIVEQINIITQDMEQLTLEIANTVETTKEKIATGKTIKKRPKNY